MTLEELIAELQALIDQYSDGTEPTEEDAARMAELTDEINQRRAAGEQAAQTRAAAVANARAAIDAGRAQRIDSVPLARSANVAGVSGAAYDVTDYDAAERRAWVKNMAESANVQLIGGTALTDAERAAVRHALEQRAEFTITTSNTADVVPVSVQQEIISLIDNSAVLFSDVTRYSMAGQFELVRHKSIKKGDAAATAEGAAPTDIEENEFDHITLTGDEIKKTVEMSRKMATQSLTGFEKYLINEISARLSVACNAKVHANLDSAELGMATANKIQTAKVNVITISDIRKMLSLLKTFNNPASKGVFVYANSDTIWNQIAAIEDSTGRAYFVESENTDDPTIQGRIYGKYVKADDSIADGVIKAGYPDLFYGNMFDGIDITPYIQPKTQKRCFDGYALYDGGLVVPQAFSQLTIKQA